MTINTIDNASVLLGHGDGTFELASHYAAGIQAYVPDVAVGDFNSDGHPDFAVTGGFEDVVAVLLNGADWPGPIPSPPNGPKDSFRLTASRPKHETTPRGLRFRDAGATAEAARPICRRPTIELKTPPSTL